MAYRSLCSLCSSLLLLSSPGFGQFLQRDDSYILAPASRTVWPSTINAVRGSVTDPQALLAPAPNGTMIITSGSSVTFDFGINIGGLVQFTIDEDENDGVSEVVVTFTESSLYISPDMSDGIGFNANTAPLMFNISGTGTYIAPDQYVRGAFRYLTFGLKNGVQLSISDLHIDYTAMPDWDDLRAYPGFFISNDVLLNRVWYAGAYTLQLCTIPPSSGDAILDTAPDVLPPIDTTISNGTSVLTDGAKRDRLVWPGDMDIAVASIMVSTGDFPSIQVALDSLFTLQNPDGSFPWAGVGIPLPGAVSFTYHLYTLIGVYNNFLWTDDVEWLSGKWDQWKQGLAWSLSNVDETGLMNVTSPFDWLRVGMGGYNGEANSILHYTLGLGLSLAEVMSDTSVVANYTSNRATIKGALNAMLWNEADGFYNDNTTTTFHPQDGNVWAVLSDVTQNSTQIKRILTGLQNRWTPFGPPALEGGVTVSPFISSFELHAHLQSNRTQPALDLMRSMWGDFMLDDPRMTNSTWIEGYSSDGVLHYPAYPEDIRVSFTHGWSSGPTSALTNSIAGIQITAPAGREWQVMPQTGDLTAVSAGFNTSLGSFEVSWARTDEKTLMIKFKTPKTTKGVLAVPTLIAEGFTNVRWKLERVNGDGSMISVDMEGAGEGFTEKFYVGLRNIQGGEYLVSAKYD